jgi:DNA-binding CsgD family transcriptional regulator
MDLAPLVRAVEVLLSPLDWGSRDAWLAESLQRVREACGVAGTAPAGDPVDELEALLRLPNDEAGWLHAALASPDAERWEGPVPAITGESEAMVLVVSLRCALLAGIVTQQRLDSGRAILPTTRELRATFGLRGREPQVALLAAEGLSNAAIAVRLRLSAHTVRHYLERVLERLGLHTRKGLALHLMAGAEPLESPPRAADRG